jgi:hypothetical protein
MTTVNWADDPRAVLDAICRIRDALHAPADITVLAEDFWEDLDGVLAAGVQWNIPDLFPLSSLGVVKPPRLHIRGIAHIMSAIHRVESAAYDRSLTTLRGRSGRKSGRKPVSPQIAKRREKLIADYRRARETGETLKGFCTDRKIEQSELRRALNWDSQRRRRAPA